MDNRLSVQTAIDASEMTGISSLLSMKIEGTELGTAGLIDNAELSYYVPDIRKIVHLHQYHLFLPLH